MQFFLHFSLEILPNSIPSLAASQCYGRPHQSSRKTTDTDAGMKEAANDPPPDRRAAFIQSICIDAIQLPLAKAHHPQNKSCTNLADAGPILLHTIQACPVAIAGILRATWTLQQARNRPNKIRLNNQYYIPLSFSSSPRHSSCAKATASSSAKSLPAYPIYLLLKV